jgi:hypothetical protein
MPQSDSARYDRIGGAPGMQSTARAARRSVQRTDARPDQQRAVHLHRTCSARQVAAERFQAVGLGVRLAATRASTKLLKHYLGRTEYASTRCEQLGHHRHTHARTYAQTSAAPPTTRRALRLGHNGRVHRGGRCLRVFHSPPLEHDVQVVRWPGATTARKGHGAHTKGHARARPQHRGQLGNRTKHGEAARRSTSANRRAASR